MGRSSAVPLKPFDQFVQPPHHASKFDSSRWLVWYRRGFDLRRTVCGIVMAQPRVDVADNRPPILGPLRLPFRRRRVRSTWFCYATPVIGIAEVAALPRCP